MLDENVAAVGDLLAAPGLFALAANGGEETSLSWVLSDDSTAAVLTGVDLGLWRLRLIDPNTVVASLLLLVDLDRQRDGAGGRGGEVVIALPDTSTAGTVTEAHERATEAIAEMGAQERAGLEHMIGASPTVHSIIVGMRLPDGTARRGDVTWSNDPAVGCSRIEIVDEAARMTPTTTDAIADAVYQLVEV
jgi:hypothetical protein